MVLVRGMCGISPWVGGEPETDNCPLAVARSADLHRRGLGPANGGTQVVQSETFRGLLVPFSGKTLARAEASFKKLNEALKKRVEAS